MDNPSALEAPVVVIGAGPAGLTAAYELTRQGRAVLVFDQDTQVGGLARTVEYRGFRFDIGGHRFFTKVPRVAALWRDWLGADFLSRPRLSRIYYRNHFFHYPLKPFDTLRKLGIGTSLGVLSSYLAAKISPIRPEVSFEDWVSNRFGRTLFRIFFESYTEKVWGMPCRTISASWAAQRIRGLSARTAILSMFRRSGHGNGIKSLVAEFEYPRLGPGMMWEACRQRVEAAGGLVCLGARVTRIDVGTDAVHAVHVERSGVTTRVPASHVISTMPIQQLVRALTPSLPPAVRQAAEDLRYRDFITVALIVDQAEVFPDNWIYIHDPSVRVGRIQNFKNWSPEMVPDAHYTCLGLEYFCFEGDDLWAASDAELIDLATREVAKIRLVDPTRVRDGSVLRVRQAYPVYDHGFEDALATVRRGLARFPNLWLVGRNGMHRYNNQDHSMLTALLAVENIMGANHDLWAVNADDEYHEGIDVDGDRVAAAVAQLRVTQPAVPRRIEPEVD